MMITFDVYQQDPTSNGEPDFIATVEHEGSNHKHMLDYLAGFTSENRYNIIRNLRIWG